MEDFIQPSPERSDLLERLEEKIGSVTPHFWAACQICDLGALEKISQYEVPIIQPMVNQTRAKLAKWTAIGVLLLNTHRGPRHHKNQ
jgi:hypothetical protein